MNNWIDRLERRYSHFAIPYLVNGLMVGQLADHKAIDKIGDGKVAVAALQPVDPIVHGQSPPVS